MPEIYDDSRSLELFRKGKTRIIAKFHRTDIVIRSHYREEKTLSYSPMNTVFCTEIPVSKHDQTLDHGICLVSPLMTE